jgi:hypothetical protein
VNDQAKPARPVRAWPLVLMALPAAVSIWAGWVGLGGMTGFGPVHLLPGIAPHFVVDTSITLPVGLEAYAALALGAWLRPGVPDAARRFAKWSAIGALALGMTGQAAYHLLAAFRVTRAPVFVIVLVACIPVAVLGFGAALIHLIRSGGEVTSEQPARHELAGIAAPLVSALAARIAPREVTSASPEVHPADDSVLHPDPGPAVHPGDHLEARPEALPASDPAGHPGAAPGTRPARPPAGDPDPHPAEAVQDHPGDARPVTPAGIARVKRKGAVNSTDEEVKKAIRELFETGKPVTPYRIKTALKGSKGGIGDGRASKLLAEVQAERPSLSAVK